MKKFGSLALVLVMVLSSVSALAALPEGYSYTPWLGDPNGVIAAEISKLNIQGVVSDRAAIESLPNDWQKEPVVGTLKTWTANKAVFQMITYFLLAELDAEFAALSLALGGDDAALAAALEEFYGVAGVSEAEFIYFINDQLVGGDVADIFTGDIRTVSIHKPLLNMIFAAIERAMP